MGQQNSLCGELNNSIAQNIPPDYEDFNLTCADNSPLDPLQKFLSSPNTLKVKTLNNLISAAAGEGRKERSEKQQGKQGGLSARSDALEEEIANRIRRKKTIQLGEGDHMQILHMLEEEIENLALQQSEKGHSMNIDDINRSTVFRKLKINLSNFIRITHDSVSAHYTFKETIGEGSFGKVYRAICKRTKEERAIKVLKHKITRKEDAKFLAQFNLLSQLDHPNIVKLYQIYYYRSFYYVVMEYCKGGSIIELIKRLKQFPEALVASIAQQLLSALAYLHQQGIVHRDIKLDNIVFLDSDHADYHIKIIDFGTAIRKTEGKTKFAGTRYYMAPEVFQGLLHEKSDLWSTGVFLFLFFTGKFPFTGKSLPELQHAITNKTLTFVEHEWQDVSMQARKLILALLERNIQKRLSARQALGHSWFRHQSTQPTTYSACNLQLLQRYQRGNNLIAIIESYLSLSQIGQQQRQRLAVVFRRIDTNNDGSIQASELMQLYRQHFGEENEEEVGNILSRIDQNQSGKIDFNQFLVAMYTRKRLFLENALTDAFNHYDVNHDGFLQRSELITLLEGCEREEIEFLLQELDVDGDDRVSLQEFLNYMRKYTSDQVVSA